MIVKVPASSANLGPGFDCFGLAWDLFNTFEFTLSDRTEIVGCPERYANENNLAYRGFSEVYRYAGLPVPDVRIRFAEINVPISRGLGSSSSLIVAGVTAANRLSGLKLSPEELLSCATRVEGHPDNVAPALFGGFTVSAMDGEKVCTEKYPVSEKLYFTGIIPDYQLSTALCRRVLPKEYSRKDAVHNVARSAFLLKAMGTGDLRLLSLGLNDRIHEPYRIPLIRGYEEARKAAEKLNSDCFFVSGAGPTLCAVSDGPEFTGKLREALAHTLPSWKVIALQPNLRGAEIAD